MQYTSKEKGSVGPSPGVNSLTEIVAPARSVIRYCPNRPLPPYRFVPGLYPHPTRHPAGHSYGPAAPLHGRAAWDPSAWRTLDDWLCGVDRSGAEDLVQDAYLAVLRRFRLDGDRVLTIEYVITTIRNRFLDHARAERREERRLRLVHSADVVEPDVASLPSQLASLPERDRTALVLRYVDALPVPEVAAAMGLTVHATESLLVRARARLRGKEARDA